MTEDTAAEILAGPRIRRRWSSRIGIAALIALLVILVPSSPVTGV